MSHSDSNFYKPFIFVLGALVLFTLFILFVAKTLSPASGEDPLVTAETRKAIAPVGRSRVVEPAEPAEEPAAEAEAAEDSQATETAEAPAATEDTVDEAAASAATEETAAAEATTAEATTAEATTAEATTAATATVASASVASAAMAELPDVSVKVKAAVATNCAGCHFAGLDGAQQSEDEAAWNALSEKGLDALTASVINGKGAMPARAESNLDDDEIRQAVQLMIANATGNTSVPVSGSVAAETSAAPAVESTEATDSTVAAATTATGVAAAPATEVPAAVKQVVDSTCAACHLAGIANAPKWGDKDAWAPRLEKGIDALVASSIGGIGIMPPRGGSQLDDEQMRLAVEYMLSK